MHTQIQNPFKRFVENVKVYCRCVSEFHFVIQPIDPCYGTETSQMRTMLQTEKKADSRRWRGLRVDA